MGIPNKLPRFSKRLRSDAGVVIPLIAVMGAIFSIVISALGVDLLLTKHAETGFRRDLDERCRTVSYNPFFQREVVVGFRDQVNAWAAAPRQRNLTITHARVYAPVFDPGYLEANFTANAAGLLSGCASGICNITSCDVGAVGTCEYVYDTTDFNAPSGGFPNNFWSGNLVSTGCVSPQTAGGGACPETPPNFPNPLVGAAVACEAVAEYSTIFFGPRIISAKSAFWRRPRGEIPLTAGGAPQGPMGIKILVAPQMTTPIPGPANFPWWEPNEGALGVETKKYLDKYSLLRLTTLGEYGSLFSTHFIGDPGNHKKPATEFDISPGGYAVDNGTPPADAGDELGGYFDYMHISGWGSEDPLWSHMAACLNPTIFVRNLIVSGLLEYLMRSSLTRYSTDLAVVNPANRRSPNTDYYSSTWGQNKPVKIVDSLLGDDLAAPQYQLPYVYYNSSREDYPVTGSIDGHFDAWSVQNKDGPINPWRDGNGNANLYNLSDQHQQFIAEQLRICYQLYSGFDPDDNGIDDRNGIDRPQFILPGNDPFDPAGFAYNPKLRNIPFAPGQPWEQGPRPWPNSNVDPHSTDLNDETNNTSRGLTAPEVAAIIGSIQSCPVGYHPLNEAFPGWPCQKPGGDNDLLPDFGSFLANHRRLPNNFGAPNQPHPFFYAPPGLFPLTVWPAEPPGPATYANEPEFPFGGNQTVTNLYRLDRNAPTVIILHRPPHQHNLLAYVGDLRINNPELTQGIFPVTVIYIPMTPTDALDAGTANCDGDAVDRVRCLFGIDPLASSVSPRAPYRNRLYVISPWADTMTGAGASCGGSGDSNQFYKDFIGHLDGLPASGVCATRVTVSSFVKSLIEERLFSFEPKL